MRDRVLLAISHMVKEHAGKVIFFNIFLAVISVIYALGNLQFQTGRTELISPHLEYRKNFKKFRAEFGDYDGLIVVAKGRDPERLKQFMDVLGFKLKNDPAHFMDVFYKIDTEYFNDKMFLFLDEKEISEVFDKLKENEGLITGLNDELGLVNLFRQINYKISRAMVGHLVSGLLDSKEETDKKEDSSPMDLGLINNILRQMNDQLNGTNSFKSPWTSFLNKENKKGSREDGYLSSPNNRIFLMTINPIEDTRSFSLAKKSVEILRERIAALHSEFPDVDAGVTGVAALESDEMIATQKDTVKASFVALIAVTLAFIFAFRGIVRPLLAMIALVSSLCWTLGWTTFFIGHLNVISVVFVTILIGLGIDFGIHLIMRYEEERKRNGSSVEEAMDKAIRGTGKGILVGALTTALAFFTMAFADFLGIVELGIIAGSGVLLSLASMLVFLPAMLFVLERTDFEEKYLKVWRRPDVVLHFDLLEQLLNFPKVVLFVGGLAALSSIYWISVQDFDYNLLKLQNESTESVQYEMDIIKNAERSAWYGAIVADSLEEARRLKKELKKLPTVGDVNSILSVYPENQEKKITLVREEKKKMPELYIPEEAIEKGVNLKRLVKALKKINFKLREDKDTWAPGEKPDETSLKKTKELIGAVLDKLGESGEKSERPLSLYQNRLFTDYTDKFSRLMESMDPSPIQPDALPKPLRDRFVGKTGKYLLQVYPKENIWDREPMDRFLSDLRSLDPAATGLAVQASESSRLMKEGYFQGGLYALITIVFITLLSLKSIRNAFLAMSPLFVGFLWLGGLMTFFELQFNLANLVILPLIIGIGVDSGVHIVARYQEGDIDDPVSIIFQSTGKAIFLSSVTTMIGFGSLMVANHYGIFSIGLLLTLGVGSCLVASTTVFPLLLRLSEKKRISLA